MLSDKNMIRANILMKYTNKLSDEKLIIVDIWNAAAYLKNNSGMHFIKQADS